MSLFLLKRAIIGVLVIGISGLLAACGEPDSTSQHLARANASPQLVQVSELLPVLATESVSLSYQARGLRNPFFWQQKPATLEPMPNRAVTDPLNPQLLMTETVTAVSSPAPDLVCEPMLLPDLVLRAIFREHAQFSTPASASALIQVADGNVHAVSVGQHWVIKASETSSLKSSNKLSAELTITAIHEQSVILQHQYVHPQLCPPTEFITLHLFD